MSRLIITLQAVDDLEQIGDYIAQDNPHAAFKVISRLEKVSWELAGNPGIGPLRPDIADGLRYFPVGNYLILYREIHQGAEIVRYVHGGRDPDNLLAISSP